MATKKAQLPKKFLGLRRFNIVMGSLHLVQAAAMYVLSNDFTLPITTDYLQATNGGFPQTVMDTWFNLRIGPLVALFLLLSAFAHFIVSSPWGYEWYVKHLKKKINYARWYEYAFSSSIMIVIIAMLSGIYNFWLLFALFGINATMNLFGLVMELHNQGKTKVNWTSFYFGSFAGLIPWIVIAAYFLTAVTNSGDNVPAFVYWILISLFVNFNIFPLNMILQYKKVGNWKDYLYGEKMYIILSLVAKSLLAWQVWGGTLRPQ